MVAPSSDGDRGENPVALTTNKDILATNWAEGAYQVRMFCRFILITRI